MEMQMPSPGDLANCGLEHEETMGVEVKQKCPRDDLRRLQLNDDTVGPVLRAKEDGQRLGAEHLKGKSREFQQLMQLWDQLVI